MSVFLILLQSLVKKLKTRSFWRHTIIGKVVCYIADAIGASDEVFWKVMVTAIVAVLLSATWLGMIPVLIGIFVIGSMQLFFIGLLGEYIMNINTRVMHKPLVIEEERLNFEREEIK